MMERVYKVNKFS